MPLRLGPTELIIILAIILIIFGVGRLGEIGGALGKGIREFRRGQSGELVEPPEPEPEPAPKPSTSRRRRRQKA
jgi:sec-independent protein translocase protein TatA